MIGQGQKSTLKLAFLAHKYRINDGFRIVVDHPQRYATKEHKRSIVSIQDHLLSFTRVGYDKHFRLAKTKMTDLDLLANPS